MLHQPVWVIGLSLGLLLINAAILYAITVAAKLPQDSARALAFALPQRGEFAFVLFALAVGAGLMQPDLQALLVLVVTLSMIATPIKRCSCSASATKPRCANNRRVRMTIKR